jgi:hypothetical protein
MSVRRATWIFAALAVLLGLGHLAITASYSKWGLDVLWFALAGVAFVLAGLLNMVVLRAPAGDPIARAIAVGANLGMTGVFLAAWPLLKGPQVIAGGLFFAALTVLALSPKPVR